MTQRSRSSILSTNILVSVRTGCSLRRRIRTAWNKLEDSNFCSSTGRAATWTRKAPMVVWGSLTRTLIIAHTKKSISDCNTSHTYILHIPSHVCAFLNDLDHRCEFYGTNEFWALYACVPGQLALVCPSEMQSVNDLWGMLASLATNVSKPRTVTSVGRLGRQKTEPGVRPPAKLKWEWTLASMSRRRRSQKSSTQFAKYLP